MDLTTLLLIIAACVGFYVAWNIGANDVANAIGTSVGSKALTLRQAVILAAIFEFAGAFFLGGEVSETLEGKIVNASIFAGQPYDYIYGMLASLLAAGLWLQIATFFGWPVSTTHSIVGAVAGFGIVVGGFDAIHWEAFVSILASWILSPLLGGGLAYLIFSLMRWKIFYQANPLFAAKKATPFFVFALFFILSLIIGFNGLKNLNFELNFFEAVGIAVFLGGVASFVAYLFLRRFDQSGVENEEAPYAKVEKIFVYLQIITACFMALAHGSNDAANAIGPLSAIFNTVRGIEVQGEQTVPLWMLALGGVGIVIGLATWGWRVIATIGVKITELTPSRGFAAEFGAATTIVLASKLGLPISTTHTLVGAVLGVGLARGIGALNLDVVRDIILSWVVTVPVGALLSVLFFYAIQAIFS